MGKISDAIRGASTPRDWRDAASAIKRAHGKGASRWLAEQCGISQRQAQRRLSGQATSGRGRGPQLADMATPEQLSADALATASGIDAGHVEVTYNGKSQGVRKIGLVHADALGGELDRAASLMADGDEAGAESVISQALLGAYSQSHGGGWDQLQGTLSISGFRTGFHII